MGRGGRRGFRALYAEGMVLRRGWACGRWLGAAAWLIAAVCGASEARAQTVTLTPAVVEAGSPELIRVEEPGITAVDGEWTGHRLVFFRGKAGRAWYALAGVDVGSSTGPSTLEIQAQTAGGRTQNLSQAIEIHPSHYRTSTLNVAPKFVEPGPDEMKRIKAEEALKAQIFSRSATEPLWTGSFIAPVRAAPTDSFGTRRIFNGELASIHKGMDFRAAMGTPVRASNSGVVVLARALYYEGNCVVIDHGLGLWTISMHLSRIEVHEGEHVVTGQRIGLSGATGRVTGPHLHWAVRWENAYLDPAKLLRMNLAAAR